MTASYISSTYSCLYVLDILSQIFPLVFFFFCNCNVTYPTVRKPGSASPVFIYIVWRCRPFAWRGRVWWNLYTRLVTAANILQPNQISAFILRPRDLLKRRNDGRQLEQRRREPCYFRIDQFSMGYGLFIFAIWTLDRNIFSTSNAINVSRHK